MDDDLIRTEQPLFDDLESDAVRPEPTAVPDPLRDEDHIPSARETRASGQPDALVSYIRSISQTPILSREQQYEIAGALEAHREAFLDAIFAVPATATEIVRRWRERKAAGYVTATFSAHHLDGSGRDLSAEIDRALGALEKLVARRDTVVRNRQSLRQSEMLGRRIARGLREAGLAFEVVVETYRGLAKAAASPRRRARGSAAGREQLEIARRSLANYEVTKQRFVRHNLKLVVKFAKQYRGMGVPFLDLIQEGNLGLIRAVEKFDHHRGHKFSTYAAWWIHQAMIRAVQKHSRTVRAPSHVYDLQLRFKRAEKKLRGRTSAEPSRTEIAAELGLSALEIDRLMSTMMPIASTHAPLAGTESLTLDDALADDTLVDPGEALDRNVVVSEMHALLEDLEPRERAVIERRFGLGDEPIQTLQVIGQRLGLSRERVRQIEAKALDRLRKSGKADHLASLLDGQREVA
ncbi:MAG: RpoD subfamily polymerase sigma-70 subunit [Deltaproteobacteria bacterium]|nr:RpoD subfamily polymerase sigma-70 subunit [Deltaproteobacteria bacterium]